MSTGVPEVKGEMKMRKKRDCFDEIVGYEDIKRELRMISDMLNNPEAYRKLGAGLNEGVLLSGRPGTGKTTMANCLIRSTQRTPYICRKKTADGSFVQEITETFARARENAPSIILLDDLDKFSDLDVGRDAEEFVTVQSCIDECRGTDVFVLATVNNIRKIPDSLLRAGRLGKQIHVRRPGREETVEIVRHFLKQSNICGDVDVTSVAMMLNGETCATLENVINNAAIKAAYRRQDEVNMQNIVDSCLDLIFEAPESSLRLSEETLRRVAYHESAHAVISEILDPGSVSIVSIRKPDGEGYGFVRYVRSDERDDIDVMYNENIIKTSLAGKAASEIVFGETDLGVNADLHNAFKRAGYLVDNTCMYGFQNWIEDENSDFVGENRNRAMAMVMERNYLEVKRLLAANRELLDRMAAELLQKTTLLYADVQRICHGTGEN